MIGQVTLGSQYIGAGLEGKQLSVLGISGAKEIELPFRDIVGRLN